MLTVGITQENLKNLYDDSYIQRAGYDKRPLVPVVHPLVTYLTATANDSFAGAYMLVRHTDIEFEIHSLIKKKYISHALTLGNMAIDWAFAHKEIERITAYVSADLESVKNYCLKIGFKLEGIRRNACKKAGKLIDVYVLGIIRADWSMKWAL